MMQRRDFITFLGGAAASWPLAARAQQPGLPVVGYFYPGPPQDSAVTAGFIKGLSEAGFVEGRNVKIEYRFGNNDPSRIAALIADLVNHKVAVIAATGGEPGAVAAKAATTAIPVVFEIGNDPVELGLVASFNKPGGNLTGVAALNSDLDAKRLGLLTELVPAVRRIGVLIANPTTSAAQARQRDLPTTIAAALGREIEVLTETVRDDRQIPAIFASLPGRRIDAVYVAPAPVFTSFRVHFATTAARYAVPVVYGGTSYVEAGGLISYGPDSVDDWRLVGTYVGRILKGDRPAELPVLQPTKFELAINLYTAKLLGISVPSSLLASADKVIE